MDFKNYNNLRNICDSRKSSREFSNKPIEPELIEKILKIAYTSPYASDKKNWEILVIDESKKILKIAEKIEIEIEKLSKKMRDDFIEPFIQYSKNFTIFKNATLLLIPTFRIQNSISIMVNENKEDIALWERDNLVKSISCVSMLILLAVESLGLGACYMTGPLIIEKHIKKNINIKNGRTIGAIIPVGYIPGR